MRLARTQSKISTILTRTSNLTIDEAARMAMVGNDLQREWEYLQDLVRTAILNDLDPENSNGDAFRAIQRERVFDAR